MAFTLSPAVVVQEIDLSQVVSAASSTLAAFAGKFNWGPVNEPRLISDETSLVRTFGYPSDYNAIDFFTLASFYAYSSGAWVTRIGNKDMVNANVTFGSDKIDSEINILNTDEFTTEQLATETVSFLAKYPGIVGNTLGVAYCASSRQYALDLLNDEEFKAKVTIKFTDSRGLALRSKELPYTSTTDTKPNPAYPKLESTTTILATPGEGNSELVVSYKDETETPVAITGTLSGATWSASTVSGPLETTEQTDAPWIDANTGNITVPESKRSSTDTNVEITAKDALGQEITEQTISTTAALTEFMKPGDYLTIDGVRYYIADITETHILLDRIYVGTIKPNSVVRYWKYATEYAREPQANSFHLVVIDTIGYFQQRGSVLETYESLSVVKDARDVLGQSAFWRNVINKKSQYLYAGGIAPDLTETSPAQLNQLRGGNDAQDSVNLDEYIKAYSIYLNAETYDTPLIISGNAITSNDVSGAVLGNYLIYSLAEVRKDSYVLLSPPLEAVLDNKGREAESCVKARNLVGSSSYASMDCNWKYMYDRYNDTYRWIPCNGDVAGIMARNDQERDAWVSPAGTTKGRMKNVVKLAWSPDRTARDILYPNDVNPVVTLPISGTVLFGDKTLLGKNTALSRVNVRRLLIIIEKQIATAASDLLFEFNDEYTQRRFVSMVQPMLEDVKNRRGLSAYKVIADGSVNTPQVIQNNGFVGVIYVKPNYTISSVKLQFVIVNASTSFEEVVGAF